MNLESKRSPDIGRWSTIIVAVVFAVAVSVLEILEFLDNRDFGFEFREFVRDLLWALSWAWFSANALRVLDTMERLALRIIALATSGSVVIWFSSTQLASTLDYGIRSASDAQNLALDFYGLAIGVIALLSVFRHGVLNVFSRFARSVRTRMNGVPDRSSVVPGLLRILAHPFLSIKRDPIRWSAIAGAVVWPITSVFAFPALLVQGVAITCAIRYADTYEGRRIIRIAALAIATCFVWFNFAVTVPFEPLTIAWLGPSLVLWTGSAVTAMFRPTTETDEAVNADDALPFHSDEMSGLGSEAVREANNNQWSRTE